MRKHFCLPNDVSPRSLVWVLEPEQSLPEREWVPRSVDVGPISLPPTLSVGAALLLFVRSEGLQSGVWNTLDMTRIVVKNLMESLTPKEHCFRLS